MAEKTETKQATKQAAKPDKPGKQAQTGGAAAEERCQVAKCKQPIRAKGYCRKHYLGWRRGDVGEKHRYKTCSKEGCRKKAIAAGRCEEHKKGAGAAEAASA